jgi:Tol biopolymer transport system component/DNA-binding winged helix-turn-helix (wHTH) protein
MMPPPATCYRFDRFLLDVLNLRLTADSENCPLEPKSFRLLQFLIENRQRAVSKDEILRVVWGDVAVTDNALTRSIAQIRKALDDNPKEPRFIETVPTVGYRFIGQLVEDPVEEPQPSLPDALLPGARSRHGWRWATVAATLAVLFAGTVWFATRKEPPNPSVTRIRQLTNSPATDVFPSFSMDGSQLAFSSNRTGVYEIYVRSLASDGAERQITSDKQENIQPVWSPDGQYLAYVSRLQGGIRVIPASGGPARVVSDGGDSPQWAPNGRQLVVRGFGNVNPVEDSTPPDFHRTLALVDAEKGSMRMLVSKETGPPNPDSPHWLPDGRHVVFNSEAPESRQTGKTGLWVVDSQTGELSAINAGVFPRFPVFSPHGDYLFFTDTGAKISGIWRARKGRNWTVNSVEPLLPVTGAEPRDLSVSPDGKRIAFSRQVGQSSIWSVQVDSRGIAIGDPKPLIENRNLRNTTAHFSADGTKIAWSSKSSDNLEVVYVANADGSSPAPITPAEQNSGRPQWIGKELTLGYEVIRNGEFSYWLHPLQGKPERVHPALDLEHSDRFRPSPDGTLLAAQVSTAGRLRVAVAGIRGGAVRMLTPASRNIGFPCWSPDGRWFAAEERTNDGAALVLFSSNGGEIRTLTTGFSENYPWDWAPDSDRILSAGLQNGIWNVYWVSISTGKVERLTHFSTQSGFVRYPSWSPQGDRILFERNDLTSNIYIADLNTSANR